MAQPESLLVVAESYLREHVVSDANVIDSSTTHLRKALAGLLKHNLMCLRRPAEYGGPEISEPDFRSFQEMVASYSGALAFLQTQHQSAVAIIAKSENDDLKSRVLPTMSKRAGLTGIGFSQLRRGGPPALRAAEVAGGYVLDGYLPWATGHAMFPNLLIAGVLPDERSVFCLVPFVDSTADGGRIQFSAPMKLTAMESARTVTAEVHQWFVPNADVVTVKPPGWIHRNDMINITLQGFFAIGCARAGVRVVESAGQKKGANYVVRAATQLTQEIDECRSAMVAAQVTNVDETTAEKLRLRGWAIDLAMRCAHAAVAASSGAANLSTHPAQRILREALVYTVSAQTGPIMESTLARLVRKP